MDECIKRDDVYEFAKDQLVKETGAYSKGLNAGLKIMMAAARNKDAIASADVQAVVKCRDCRWAVFTSYGDAYGCSYVHPSPNHILSITGNFFCAYGERSICGAGEYADNPTLAPA